MSLKDTVTISIHKYNELRDIEKGLKDNKFIIFHDQTYFSSPYYEYLSKKEFESILVKKLTLKIERLNDVLSDKNAYINQLEEELKKSIEKKWWK